MNKEYNLLNENYNLVEYCISSGKSYEERRRDAEELFGSTTWLNENKKSMILNFIYSGANYLACMSIWEQTILCIKENIKKLDGDISFSVLNLNPNDFTGKPPIVTEQEIINSAKTLGYIDVNSQSKLSNMLNFICAKSISKDNIELQKVATINFIKHCSSLVLSVELNKKYFSQLKVIDILNSIQNQKSKSELLNFDKINFNYCIKKVIINTLIYVFITSPTNLYDNILHRMDSILPNIWDSLLPQDKWNIGFLYNEIVNMGDYKYTIEFKKTLYKCSIYDKKSYIPRNQRITEFYDAADRIKQSFEKENRMSEEFQAVEDIYILGDIPIPAINVCLSSIIISSLGDEYEFCESASSMRTSILNNIDKQYLISYFNQSLQYCDDILIKLLSPTPFKRWIDILEKYNIKSRIISNDIIKNLIKFTITANHKKVRDLVMQILSDPQNQFRNSQINKEYDNVKY